MDIHSEDGKEIKNFHNNDLFYLPYLTIVYEFLFISVIARVGSDNEPITSHITTIDYASKLVPFQAKNRASSAVLLWFERERYEPTKPIICGRNGRNISTHL